MESLDLKKKLCSIKYKVIISNNIIRLPTGRFFQQKNSLIKWTRDSRMTIYGGFFPQQFPHLFLDELSYKPGKLHTHPKKKRP